MTVRRKPKVGGKRKGAGRPAQAGSKTKHVLIRMAPARRKQLDAVATAAAKPPTTWAHDALIAGLDAAETEAGARIVERIRDLDDADPDPGWEDRALERAQGRRHLAVRSGRPRASTPH